MVCTNNIKSFLWQCMGHFKSISKIDNKKFKE